MDFQKGGGARKKIFSKILGALVKPGSKQNGAGKKGKPRLGPPRERFLFFLLDNIVIGPEYDAVVYLHNEHVRRRGGTLAPVSLFFFFFRGFPPRSLGGCEKRKFATLP